MRRVGADVSEVGRLRFMLLLDPTQRGLEEDIGTEAFRLNDRVVVQDHIVKVLSLILPIGWKIGTTPLVRLSDPAGTVNEDLAESSVVRLIRIFVTKMPLAEDAGFIAHLAKKLREGRGGKCHPFPLFDRVSDAISELMASAKDRRAGRSTGRADMEVGESRRHRIEAVQIRRPQQLVAQAGKITHSLVIGHHQNDVGPRSGKRIGRGARGCDEYRNQTTHKDSSRKTNGLGSHQDSRQGAKTGKESRGRASVYIEVIEAIVRSREDVGRAPAECLRAEYLRPQFFEHTCTMGFRARRFVLVQANGGCICRRVFSRLLVGLPPRLQVAARNRATDRWLKNFPT